MLEQFNAKAMNATIDGMKNAISSPTVNAFCGHQTQLNGNPVTSLAEQANKLLDFSQKLYINLLDSVVNCMYGGEGAQQRVAQEILTTLKKHPDAWTRVDTILEFSSNQETKYYALQILENLIKTRWNILPENHYFFTLNSFFFY